MRRAFLPALLLVAGCQSRPPEPYDYARYLEHTPRSILVLPPLNESPDVEAAGVHLSTVTRPLAELGYYVFPVAVVERLMRANGVPTAWEMHEVPLERIEEVIGADAVLYLSIRDWGTSFQVVSSRTNIALHGRLVDVRSGVVLWEGEAELTENEPTVGTDPFSFLTVWIGKLVKTAATDDSIEDLSREVHARMLRDPARGLLPGPRHPDHAAARAAAAGEAAPG